MCFGFRLSASALWAAVFLSPSGNIWFQALDLIVRDDFMLIILGEVYLDKLMIEVPHTWTEADCRTPLTPACLPPTSTRVGVHL